MRLSESLLQIIPPSSPMGKNTIMRGGGDPKLYVYYIINSNYIFLKKNFLYSVRRFKSLFKVDGFS